MDGALLADSPKQNRPRSKTGRDKLEPDCSGKLEYTSHNIPVELLVSLFENTTPRRDWFACL
jgi:hypothetical protein